MSVILLLHGKNFTLREVKVLCGHTQWVAEQGFRQTFAQTGSPCSGALGHVVLPSALQTLADGCLPAPQPPPPSPPTALPCVGPAPLFKNLFVLKNLLAMPHGTWDLSSLASG